MAIERLPYVETPQTETEEIKHTRALHSVYTNLGKAVSRINTYTADREPEEVIKKIHTAMTDVVAKDGETIERLRYYTLWTDFADMRILETGELVRSNYYEGKYQDTREKGADNSSIVRFNDLQHYPISSLLSLADKLDKILKSEHQSEATS